MQKMFIEGIIHLLNKKGMFSMSLRLEISKVNSQ